jgi:lipid-A-disaccharide synthase-like uncharacterized protein
MKLQSVLISDCISLFFMTLFTLITIVDNQKSVSYIIYLFWFSKFLRTLLKIGFYLVKRDKVFILFAYFIFIFIFFGIMPNWENTNLILINL